MKREDDLIRALMLDLETADRYVNDRHAVDGYTRDQVAYHLALIVEAGFAKARGVRYSSTGHEDPTIPSSVTIERLTSSGHDFIATIRDEALWRQVKQRLAKVGGSATLEIIGQLGSAAAKQLLGLSSN